MGTFKPSSKFDAPFALDPRKPMAPPGDVFGDAWVGGGGGGASSMGAMSGRMQPSVNQNAPFGTDDTAAPIVPEVSARAVCVCVC